MERTKGKTNRNRYWKHALIAFILLASFFYKLPYYVTVPGEAKQIAPLVDVADGYRENEGTFMLTTVQMGKANVYDYAISLLKDDYELISEKQLRPKHETIEQFFLRQKMMMSSSQQIAKVVAYRAANKQVTRTERGVLVSSIAEGMPAADKLQAGDRITAVNNKKITSPSQLNEQLINKREGERVTLTVVRNEVESTLEIALAQFPKKYNVPNDQAGLGLINPMTDYDVLFEPNITIASTDIGGPSAGLMFSLEIYNQLIEEDITKGYQIAGTGQINEDGTVSRIGGVKQKVIAAHKANADIFFVPNEEGRSGSNYEEALKKAEQLRTKMEIIPVESFDDALQFLQSLDRKSR